MNTLLNERKLFELPRLFPDAVKKDCEQMNADDFEKYDVFLGGSCGETQWRQSIVIPRLTQLGISYFNPQVEDWTEGLIEAEENAKQHSKILLFVVDHRYLSVVSLIEIAYLAARQASMQKSTLVVVLPDIDCSAFSKRRRDCSSVTEDHRRTHALLKRILSQHDIPLLKSVRDALKFIEWKLIGTQAISEGILNPRVRAVYSKILFCKVHYYFWCQLDLSYLLPWKLFRTPLPHQQSQSLASFKLQLLLVQLLLLISACFCCSLPIQLTVGVVFLVHSVYEIFRICLPKPPVSRKCTPRAKRPATYDVYLGFSGDQSDILTCVVLPQLNKNGLSYLDSSYCNDDDQRRQMIESCSVLLFVIPSCINLLSGLVELSYYIGLRWKVIGCILESAVASATAEEAGLCSQTVSDYQRGLLYLKDMAHRSNILIFGDVRESTKYVVDVIKSSHC